MRRGDFGGLGFRVLGLLWEGVAHPDYKNRLVLGIWDD